MAKAKAKKPSGMKTGPRKLAKAAQKQRAIEMRLARHTYASIGSALGIATKTAWNWINEAMIEHSEAIAEGGEKLRAQELAHLDHLARALAPRIEAGEPQAVATALRIAESRHRLLGLDEPMKLEAKAQVTGGVLVVPGPMSEEEWTRRAVPYQAKLQQGIIDPEFAARCWPGST